MWLVVCRREWTQYLRDQRFIWMVAVTVLILTTGLVTGASLVQEHHRQTSAAHADDEAAFVSQGRKNPHAAAHFGRMVFKPLAPYAAFDPGASAYLGRAIWLEAHTRSPAMLRKADDAPAMSRLADFSVAGVLALVVPLLIVIVGAPIIAAEKARGTLRQMVAAGVGSASIFTGKLLALSSVGIAASTIVIVGAGTVIVFLEVAYFDALVLGGCLVVGYSVYGLGFAAVSVAVSARARSPAAAQLGLVGLWAVTVIVVPRLASSAADQLFPTPQAIDFWAEAGAAVAAERPKLDSEAFRQAANEIARRAKTATAAVNRAALRLEVAEGVSRRVFAERYRTLFDTYARQKSLRQVLSIFSPTIALRHFSAAVCGTDVEAHRHFSEAAERSRQAVVRRMNEDMLVNGAQQGFAYTAGPDLWAKVPTFTYRPPTAMDAISRGAVDLLVLLGWTTIACLFAWGAVRRSLEGDGI